MSSRTHDGFDFWATVSIERQAIVGFHQRQHFGVVLVYEILLEPFVVRHSGHNLTKLAVSGSFSTSIALGLTEQPFGHIIQKGLMQYTVV